MSKKFVLYTIPFAGGSSLSYAGWNKYLSSDIELMNLDYSGHGKRIGEGLISNFDDVVCDILNQIKDSLNNRKFLIYGHSMGGMVAYYTSHILQDKFHIIPELTFIGACSSPNNFSRGRKRYTYDEIVNQMLDDNRITPKIVQTEEFNKQIYPIIENDYNMLCRQFDVFSDNMLMSRSVCLYGLRDNTIAFSEVREWSKYILRGEYRSIDDDHYFNENSAKAVCNIINSAVSREM